MQNTKSDTKTGSEIITNESQSALLSAATRGNMIQCGKHLSSNDKKNNTVS